MLLRKLGFGVLAAGLALMLSAPVHAADSPWLVSTEWLAANKDAPNLLILDASQTFAYLDGHIPGAVSVSFPEDQASSLDYPVSYGAAQDFLMDTEGRHAWTVITDPQYVQEVLRSFGANNDSRIIIYDHGEYMMASRLFFEFYIWGFRNMAILDGGYKKWAADGQPVSREVSTAPKGNMTVSPQMDTSLIAYTDDIFHAIGDRENNILLGIITDIYHYGDNYAYTGHIPYSVNLQGPWFFNEDGTYKSAEELEKMLKFFGGDSSKNIFTQ